MIGRFSERGPSRIRTGDGGFAIHCLTAWLRGRLFLTNTTIGLFKRRTLVKLFLSNAFSGVDSAIQYAKINWIPLSYLASAEVDNDNNPKYHCVESTHHGILVGHGG